MGLPVFQIGRYLRLMFTVSGGDVHITSFPKSGRNYISFIIGNFLASYYDSDVIIDFDNYKEVVATDGPRQPKMFDLNKKLFTSHLDWVPNRGNNVLLVRHPVNVMESYFNFLTKRYASFSGDFSDFVRDPKYGIERWVKHTRRWKDKADAVIRYEDLVSEDPDVLKCVLKLLGKGFENAQECIDYAFSESRFDKMSQIELGGTTGGQSRASQEGRFVRSGRTDGRSGEFSQADLEYLENTAGDLMRELGYEVLS